MPNNKGESTGWLVILAGPNRERELLAVLACEVGLDYARKFAGLLAAKYRITGVTEELNQPDIALIHELSTAYEVS